MCMLKIIISLYTYVEVTMSYTDSRDLILSFQQNLNINSRYIVITRNFHRKDAAKVVFFNDLVLWTFLFWPATLRHPQVCYQQCQPWIASPQSLKRCCKVFKPMA